MRTGFIGAGKVGTSLGKLFSENGIRVIGYYSRHIESAREASLFTNTLCYDDTEKLIQDSDTIFLTVPDGVIAEVFQSIRKFDIGGKVIAHCSGSLSAQEAFQGIEETGARGISVHPLFPVSDRFSVWQELTDAFFCLEGDEEKVKCWDEMLISAGLKVKRLLPGTKVTYHAACAVVSNLVCALAAESLKLMHRSGFTQEEALLALAPLMRSNLEHILESGPAAALTGPVERNDISTVEKHLRCFDSKNERMIYALLSQELVLLAKERHPERDCSLLDAMLSKAL